MKNTRKRCVLLTNNNPYLAAAAEKFCASFYDVRYMRRNERGDDIFNSELREIVKNENVDYLFNFLSPVIIPEKILKFIKKLAINFHPAPPEYPGVGSASYALYEKKRFFGATAHVINKTVDAGRIIKVLRFPIIPAESCDDLFDRALNYSLVLFYEVLGEIYLDGGVKFSNESWKRKAVKRAEFEKWMTLSSTDSKEDVTRKIRALKHKTFPGPFINIHGHRFELSRK